jgi:hypothetical protein
MAKQRFKIYDNGGATMDRYTLLDMQSRRGDNIHDAVFSGNDPRGMSGHCDATPGKHLGKLIRYTELPKAVRVLFYQCMLDSGHLVHREAFTNPDFDYDKNATLQYARNPTAFELKQGYGAIHYADIPLEHALHDDGTIKARLRLDGLTYWRP